MTFSATSPGTGSPYYGGGQVSNPANVIFVTSNPGTGPTTYPVGTIAIRRSTGSIFQLANKTSTTATWVTLGGSATDVNTLTGDSGGAISPTGGTITVAGGTGISTAGAGSTITFNSVGGGLKTTVSASTPSTIAINTRLVPNTGGLYTVNLPATAAVGSVFQVTGNGAGGWLIQCGTGQTINASGGSTSSAGSLASTNRYDSVEFVCVVANTTFTVESQNGVLTNA